MVRLGLETFQACDSRLNPVGDRERICRDLKIPEIENLALLRDTEETLDFTGNSIRSLANFPLMSRLRCLMLASNKISTIDPEIGRMLPNLQVLILANNHLVSPDDLKALEQLSSLQFLDLTGNPVTQFENYRSFIIDLCPKLRFLDYSRVKQTERSQKSL